jgi:hypothetical protein
MTMPPRSTPPSRLSRPIIAILSACAILALLVLAACGSTAATGGTALASGNSPDVSSAGGSSAVSTHTPGTAAPTPAHARTPGATAPTPVPTRPAVVPTPPPTPQPDPTATPAPSGGCGIYYLCNPWRYTFVCCQNVYLQMVGAPTAPQFCALFTCNISFYANNGAVVQCGDGTFTRTSGIGKDSNTCTSGGTRRPLLYCPPSAPVCQQP